MTKVKCPQTKCVSNKEGICQREEIELEQEPYHTPECLNMRCPLVIRGKRRE